MEKEELLLLGVDEETADKIISGYELKIEEMRRSYELDKLLRESGAKNIRAVKALIEGDDYISEIKRLKEGEDTSFLFERRKSFVPITGSEKLPDTQKNDFEARLKEARKRGDTLEAIKIKQEASCEGITLI